MLYVFEGATLGGRVIERHLPLSDDGHAAPSAYFAGRGRQTGPMWRETCALLQREAGADGGVAAADAARAAFASLHDWLKPWMDARKEAR